MWPKSLRKWPILSLLESELLSNIRMVLVHGVLSNRAIFVTNDKMVYAVGNNNHGCLGVGDTESSSRPRIVEVLCGKDIKTFAVGKGPHILALTEDGKVYAWGYNDHFELGNGSTEEDGLIPELVQKNLSNKFVVDIACGGHYSLALTGEGEVYGWGENKSGQIDHEISANQNVPIKIAGLEGTKVRTISCGHSFGVAVTNKNEVYGWGCNEYGQIGITNSRKRVTGPRKITELVGVMIDKVACGRAHTLALSNEGVLYAWGLNKWGQLGLDHKNNSSSPEKVQATQLGRALDVACSHFCDISVAMGENNRIFIWGHCMENCLTVPTLVSVENFHVAFACFSTYRGMHQPLILRGEQQHLSLADCFRQALDDQTTSDLVIQVEGKRIFVHKAVLAIRSKYFKAMFGSTWSEGNQRVIEHRGHSYDVYEAFLRYLYTDQVNLPLERLLELLKLANEYCEVALERRCIETLKREITFENVASVHEVAVECNVKELEECCLKFAELDQDTMNSITARAAAQ